MQQQNEKYLPKIKPVFLQSLKGYGPAFDDEDFASYLAKSLLGAVNIMIEASKLAKELKEKDKAQKKLEEFIHHEKALLYQKFDNLLKKAYPSFQSQNKQKYVEYLVALTQGQNGFAKYKEIFESLAGPNVKPAPPYFNEFKAAVAQNQKDKMWEIFKKNFPEYEKLSGSKYIDYLWSLMNKREDAAKLYPEIGRALSTPPQDPHILPPYWNDYKAAQTEMDKDKCREAFRTNFSELHKQVGNKYIDFLFSLVRPEEAPRRHRDFIEGLANTAARFPPYWQDFQEKESRRHGDVKELIKKKHPEHCEGQYGAKFLEYINNQAHSDPQTHDAIMKEISQETKLTPPKWYEFLRAELGDERLKKLEIIRRDPQFLTYIEYRKQRFEQYKQNFVGRTEQEQKQFNNMKMYVEQLTTIINLFQKLLYFNLYQSHFGQIFAFFEKDFDAYKKNNAARAVAASHETHEQKDTLPKDPRTQALSQQNLATAPTNPQHHQQSQNYMRQSAGYADSLSQGHAANQMPTTTKDSYQSQPQVSSSQMPHQYPQQSQQQYPQHSTPTHSTHSAHSTHSTAHQAPSIHSSQNLHQSTYQQQQQQQRPSGYSQQPSHATPQQSTNAAPTHPQQSRAPQTQTAPYSQSHAGGMPQKTQSHPSGYQMGQQTQQQYPQTASQPQTSKYLAHTQPTTQHHQTVSQQNLPSSQYVNPHAAHHPQQTTQQTMHGQIPLQSPTKQTPLHAQAQPQMKSQPQPMQPINQVQSPGLKQNVLPHQTQPHVAQPSHHQPTASKPMGSYDMMKMQAASSGYEQQQQQQAPTEPLGTSQPSKYQYKPTYDTKAAMGHSAATTSQKSQLPLASQTFGSAQQPSGGQMQIENPYMPRDSQPQVQAPLQTQQPHAQPHIQPHAQPHVQPQQQPQAQPQKAPLIPGQKADMKRPRFTEKERFENFNLDSVTLEDGERRLGEVYKKLKNPYGNYEIIDNFIQNLYTELAESEAEHKVEKRLKTNPDPSQEINVFPDKSKTTMSIEQTNNIKAPQTFVQQPVNPFENDITDIKMDDRFKVEDKGNHSSPSFDLVIYKNNDGIISFHDKLVVRLEKDAIPKISIQEMANLSEFFIEYKDMLEDALTKGRLKEILELWLEFIEKCAMKLESKLSAFDDLFG